MRLLLALPSSEYVEKINITSDFLVDTWFRFGHYWPRFPLPPETTIPDLDAWKVCSQLLNTEFEGATWNSSEKVPPELKYEGSGATSTMILERRPRGKSKGGHPGLGTSMVS